MNNYKEIVTKAVIGKSKKNSNDNFTMTVENTPNTVLGCWVINHKFNGMANGNDIKVNGSYDVNVWYSYDNDTKTAVAKETFSYTDTLPVHLKENISDGREVMIRSLNGPTVNEVKIDNGKVNLSINKELAAEVVGNAKIKVPVEVLDDDYEEITEANTNNEVEIEQIDEVNEEYLD